MTPYEQARQFIKEEKEFRLGSLVTEQSHPITKDLSSITQRSTENGLRNLLEVDIDNLPKIKDFFTGENFSQLIQEMYETVMRGGRIFFTGCGATGRLSILLESAWREFWIAHPSKEQRQYQVISVMAGGDFALIKSVEGFEDYQEFGKQQILEHNLNSNDMVVAITEGGETSFVIGTAWAGVEKACTTWIVYNNPTELLREKVTRSREIIECEQVNTFDLCTGPMAIAGSTRMQATTVELLIVGAALETCILKLLNEYSPTPLDFSKKFEALLYELSEKNNLKNLAHFTEEETHIFQREGTVTYLAHQGSLDLLTDTTERSPTFSIPPFRKISEEHLPIPFCFLKHPSLNTPDAWKFLLKRPIRGIDWHSEEYQKFGAPEKIINDPPDLSAESVESYQIGKEEDRSRIIPGRPNCLSWLLVKSDFLDSSISKNTPPWLDLFEKQNSLIIGGGEEIRIKNSHTIQSSYEISPLRLWEHLASKLVLNTHSTASMALADRVRGNWMIHVQATNKKLIDRATRLISDLAHIPYEEACVKLHEAMNEISEIPSDQAKPSPAFYALEKLI